MPVWWAGVRVVHVVAGMLLTALVAGCAGDPSGPAEEDDVPASIQEVEVTATTGAIRGFVVDEAIVPLEGVLVTLMNGLNGTTGEDGGFVFNDLEPGDYFLTASKKGFGSQQAAATVEAGDEDPDITKITLPRLPSGTPFTQQQIWEGFIQCAFMAGDGFVGMNTCGIVDDRFIHYFDLGGQIPDFAQAESVWDSTQALGNDLSLSFYDGGTWHFKEVHGVSPLIINANATEIADWWTENATELPMRMFPGSGAVAVTYNQQFTVYMTMFYNFMPREGWAFIVDGPCDKPSDCE